MFCHFLSSLNHFCCWCLAKRHFQRQWNWSFSYILLFVRLSIHLIWDLTMIPKPGLGGSLGRSHPMAMGDGMSLKNNNWYSRSLIRTGFHSTMLMTFHWNQCTLLKDTLKWGKCWSVLSLVLLMKVFIAHPCRAPFIKWERLFSTSKSLNRNLPCFLLPFSLLSPLDFLFHYHKHMSDNFFAFD